MIINFEGYTEVGLKSLIDAGLRWKAARRAVCEASVFDATYRAKLNELSEAEDALSRAVSDDL
jgi:hypothetical protein